MPHILRLVLAALLAAMLPGAARAEAPLDTQAQAAALLPQFRGDLARAGEWNRYTLEAVLNPARRTLSGRLRLEYTNRDTAPHDRLYFQLYPNLRAFGGRLEVAAAAVDGARARFAYEGRRFLLRVDLPRSLEPGAGATVSLDFTTSAPANASRSHYGAFTLEGGVFALATAYPLLGIVRGGKWATALPDARGDFVNSETALYEATLTAPAGWTLVTSGVVVDGRLDGGRQVARVVSGPQREFAITLVRLQAASAEVDGTRINSYFRPEHAQGGQMALRAAVDALRAFNKRFGSYPLAELDVVEIEARTFLGVEYPGLVMIDRRLYERGSGLEITVAHEVGHQWWYSLVGNDVQAEAWLDEGLTSYAQVIYQEEVHGAAAAERELDGFRQRYLALRAARGDGPVARPAGAFRGNYVALVYAKGALFFQALREEVGELAFDRFLRGYYQTHRYNRVTGAELVGAAEATCGCELDALYRDWIITAAPVEVP
ncbi:MAG TPA: M1 family metallopeptidase [Roseiflexaceae bacterium]|nr:M1 family metallopeptidase [Roseiflexaceae bacterium]